MKVALTFLYLVVGLLTTIGTTYSALSSVSHAKKKGCSVHDCRTMWCRGIAASRGLCFNRCGRCPRP